MSEALETLEQIARTRQTTKVISESDLPIADDRPLVDRLLASAGWAPFHKICSPDHRQEKLDGIEPWRFHNLDARQCRLLRRVVIDEPSAGKIPGMLAAARAMILVTWLPNPSSPVITDVEYFEPTVANVEHIAAASAAVQTLLLAATAAGVSNYWSSGGVLRNTAIFDRLGIPTNQRLLGAIFLFPDAIPGGVVEIHQSKLRDQRSSPDKWSRWIEQ